MADALALMRHGEAGAPLLYLPSSGGDQHEFARYGMLDDLAPWVEQHRLRVYAVDGAAPRHLWNEALAPQERMRGYARFERELALGVLPAIAAETGALPFVVGSSYGAFAAANLLFKYPERIVGACGLGGVYGLWHRLDGHHDDEVYFHTPLEYLPRLADASMLAAVRRTAGLALFAGDRDEWLASSERLADVMARKSLPHRLDVWRGDVGHHERWWRRQLLQMTAARYGPP